VTDWCHFSVVDQHAPLNTLTHTHPDTASQGHKVHCWSELEAWAQTEREGGAAGCMVDERFHSRYETTSAVHLLITVELFARVSAYTQLFLARIVCARGWGGSGSVFGASCADC